MQDHPVVVSGLVARYGDHTVLDGVDLRVQRGTVHVILGGSGSGKSTLLKHLVGLLQPAAGSVRLLGVELAGIDEVDYARLMVRVGMLFQGGALLNSQTLHDNVALPLRERTLLPESIIDEMVRMKLDMVGLGHAAARTPPELSGGMKKRAALARAMALDPELLFCDEPSAGLDPVTAAELDDLLLSLRERFGATVVVVTHELASIERIADQVTMLARGKVVLTDTLAQARGSAQPDVRAFFDRAPNRDNRKGDSLFATLSPDRAT